MRNLGSRAAAHEAIVNKVARVGPGPDLVLDQLLREDRGVAEGYLVAGRRRADVVKEDIVQLTLLRRYMVVSKIVSTDACYSERLERFLLLDRLHQRVKCFRLPF